MLSDLLHLHPTAAVRWVHDAGGDWTRYAAQLINTRDDKHDECLTPSDPKTGTRPIRTPLVTSFADAVPEVAQSRRLGHILGDRIQETYSHVARIETRLLDALNDRWGKAVADSPDQHAWRRQRKPTSV